MTTLKQSPHLTALDRCDRCGAQAKVLVLLRRGRLTFCAHHGREYAPALDGQAVVITEDE